MKKTTKSNPLKFFNDAKEARNKSFSKSLPRADEGVSFKNTYAGPITESDSKRLDQQFPSTVPSHCLLSSFPSARFEQDPLTYPFCVML